MESMCHGLGLSRSVTSSSGSGNWLTKKKCSQDEYECAMDENFEDQGSNKKCQMLIFPSKSYATTVIC